MANSLSPSIFKKMALESFSNCPNLAMLELENKEWNMDTRCPCLDNFQSIYLDTFFFKKTFALYRDWTMATKVVNKPIYNEKVAMIYV